MPRPKKPGAPEPKRRSRNGCWPCKARKVKCGEEHPSCTNCQKTGETCDYSVRLNWEGRRTKRSLSFGSTAETAQLPEAPLEPQQSPFNHTFSSSNSLLKIHPKSTVRRAQTSPESLTPGQRKLEPLGSIGDGPNQSGNASFGTASHRLAQMPATALRVPEYAVTTAPPKVTSALQRSHKRAKSLAESSDSEGPRQHGLVSSPTSLTGTSPPVSRLRSGTGSISAGSPLTPVSLGFRYEDDTRSPMLSLPSPASPENSRLTVNYLLSGSPNASHGRSKNTPSSLGPPFGSAITTGAPPDEGLFYGPCDTAISNGIYGEASWRFESIHSASVRDGYYRQPVPIWIPRNVHPLPPKLLGQKEPQMRIALWVQDIFPVLRQALGDREQIISNTSLATAVMLASLEIISPTAFGYDIPWQRHLNLARDLMWRRLAHLRRTARGLEEDRICAFLWSWFAYLDILGSLSGGMPDESSSRFRLLEYITHDTGDDMHEIDCIMGFTARCVQILAQIAELARVCDEQRLGPGGPPPSAWTPGPVFVQRARQLEQELMDSMSQPSPLCKHIQSVEDKGRQEMVLMNEAFHWAGLVHLRRRVLGKPPGHEGVQGPVRRIVACLECIRPGGSAETGFVFPMFTAGCNALDEGQRGKILERFRSVESNGMT
ncbi:hypothetical protein CTA2_11248, partial [Colletotrichum tanaceti]